MDKVLIYSIIFSLIKIFILVIWFFLGAFLIKLGLTQNNRDTAYTITEFVGKYYKYNKFKLLMFIVFTISILFFFSVEPAHRPKTNMNELSKGSPQMMDYTKQYEIIKEKKPDYQKMLDDHREESKNVKEQFNNIE